MPFTDALARLFVHPVWIAGPPEVEEWTCPACGRAVLRTSPAVKNLWVTAGPAERVALCARQHGAHDRQGAVPPPKEHRAPVRLAELVTAPEDERWIPVHTYGDRPVSEGFVALVAPAGVVFVPATDGADEKGGADLLAFVPAELSASDLVGSPPAAPTGPVWGRLRPADLRFDDAVRPTALDAACLAPLVEPLDEARRAPSPGRGGRRTCVP